MPYCADMACGRGLGSLPNRPRRGNVEPPQTSDGGTQADRRTADKLLRSPGSFFSARASQLILAPAYFHDRLPPDAYQGTANRHLANLCGATYAMLLSAFELTWKALYARIIDATSEYDSNLVAKKNAVQLTTENVLAHREQATAGGMIAAGFLTWQRPDAVNDRFQQLVEMAPIDEAQFQLLGNLWQIRHVLSHSSGVLSPQDAYRITWDLKGGDALHIDIEHLRSAGAALLDVVEIGIARVGRKLLDDFFEDPTKVFWERDHELYSRLALLGMVVPRTQDLPEVDEEHFEQEKQARQQANP